MIIVFVLLFLLYFTLPRFPPSENAFYYINYYPDFYQPGFGLLTFFLEFYLFKQCITVVLVHADLHTLYNYILLSLYPISRCKYT